MTTTRTQVMDQHQETGTYMTSIVSICPMLYNGLIESLLYPLVSLTSPFFFVFERSTLPEPMVRLNG